MSLSRVAFTYVIYYMHVKFITIPKDGGDSVIFVSVAMYLYILLLYLYLSCIWSFVSFKGSIYLDNILHTC